MRSDKDYFVCNRSLFKNPLWYSEKFTKGQAWIDLFGKANHSDGWFEKNGQRVDVKRGQTGRSIEKLAEEWKWSRNKVKRFLKRLEDDHMIERKPNHLTTIITICNYDKYQLGFKDSEPSNEPPDEPSNEPPDEPQTIKNKERIKEELIKPIKKIVKKPKTDPPSLDEIQGFIDSLSGATKNLCRDKNIGQLKFKQLAESCFDYFKGKGEQKADWEATVRNWIRNDEKFNKKSNSQSKTGTGGYKSIAQKNEELFNQYLNEDLEPEFDIELKPESRHG